MQSNKKKVDQIGLPFIGGELNFTAEFADIQCARLLCCETTFRTKTI